MDKPLIALVVERQYGVPDRYTPLLACRHIYDAQEIVELSKTEGVFRYEGHTVRRRRGYYLDVILVPSME